MNQKLSDFIDDFLNVIMGFRKLIAFICVFIFGNLFMFKGMINGGQWVDLMKTIFMGFVAANGVEHYTSMVKQQIASRLPSITKQVLNKEES